MSEKPSYYPFIIVLVVLLAVAGPPVYHFMSHQWQRYTSARPLEITTKKEPGGASTASPTPSSPAEK